MDESRRAFLSTALAGLAGLAGCSGDTGVSYPGDETTTTNATTVTTSPPKTNTTTTTTEQPTEEPTTTTVPVPPLGQDTAVIANEIDWFGNAYPATIEHYLSLCDQAIATIQQLRRSSTLTETQLAKLRTATMRAADYFDATLEPHFDVYGPVPEPHLEEISTFARRGDIDRAHTELDELLDHFQDVSSGSFVNRELSRNPIHDRLYESLTAPNPGRVLFGFVQHTSGFSSWVYPTTPTDFSQYTWNGVNDDYRDVFGPTTSPAGRTDLVSLTINRVPENLRWDKNSMPHVPVLLQRFHSRAAAQAAYSEVVNTSVTVEGQTAFGRGTWDEVYYYFDGDIQYAYLLQVGSFVLSMAPSQTPWDERPGIERDIVKRTWLWN